MTRRRPAVTLIEALMAILVMAIGLLALLTLFPLGAFQMAQALKDDRCAGASNLAVTQWKSFDLPNDGSVNTTLFENPWPNNLFALRTGFQPSYPVYVDPIGLANMGASGPPNTNVGGIPFGVPRVTVSRVPQPPQSGALPAPQWQQRWFTLQDDLTFTDNGVPDVSSGAVAREGRYSWAYLVRRQQAATPAPALTPGTPQVPPIDLTVVVYSGRAAGADFSGNPMGETAYTQAFFGYDPTNPAAVSGNLISVNYGATGQPRPPVRRGSWVFDARMLTVPPVRPNVGIMNVPQGYFYRVVSVNDSTNGIVNLEVQRPLGGQLRVFGTVPGTNQPYPAGPIVVMDGVAEVFEKGTSYLQHD